MKRLPWAYVVVISVVLVCVTALALTHNDSAGLITVGLAVFTGIGIVGSQTHAVKEQTNGNTTQLVSLVRELAHMAYQAYPTTPQTPGPPIVPPSVTTPGPGDPDPSLPFDLPTQRPGE